MTSKEIFSRGVWLFNQKRYFEAHEAWETVWKGEKDQARKEFLQGLIQIAAGMYKWRVQNNAEGGRWLLTRGLARVKACRNAEGLDLVTLGKTVDSCLKAMVTGQPPALWPKV